VRAGLARLGYSVQKLGPPPIPIDCDEDTAEVIRRVQPYTLTPPKRVMALREAIRYVVGAGIEGAVVECGVWRGGSMMAAAMTLLELEASDRELHMFDTFTEMPAPDERDVGVSGVRWSEIAEETLADPVFELLPLQEVRRLIEGTGYQSERLHFHQGLVEETIPDQAPETIALCRLDTDWYRSTAHEMRHLYPRIAPGGVLIVDDYGEFLGAREAVDEFLEADGRSVMLNRVDSSCRVIVVPDRAR
jgi:O-methyltransferase